MTGGVDAARSERRWNVGGWLLVAIVAVAMVILWRSAVSGVVSGGPDLVPWRSDHQQAFRDAEVTQRPTFLYFTADWCPPCQVMRAEVYSDPAVAELLGRRFIPVKVDMTAPGALENQIAGRFGIMFLPTMLLLSPSGEVVDAYSGGPSLEAFTDWLKASLREHGGGGGEDKAGV